MRKQVRILGNDFRSLREHIDIKVTGRSIDDRQIDDNLEARLKTLEAGQEGLSDLGEPIPRSLRDMDIQEIKSLALDVSELEASRLEALRSLRAADQRDHDVINSMVELWWSTSDHKIKADIFRQMHGVTGDSFESILYEGLKDQDKEVREEAAESLDAYLPDTEIEDLLISIVHNDPDRRVRDQAVESLRDYVVFE